MWRNWLARIVWDDEVGSSSLPIPTNKLLNCTDMSKELVQSHQERNGHLTRSFTDLLNTAHTAWKNFPMEKKIYITELALLEAVQVVDIVSTYVGLQLPNVHEGNPFMNQLIMNGGFAEAQLVKIATVTAGISLLEVLRKKKDNVINHRNNNLLQLINTVGATALINNACVLLMR